MPQSVQHAWQIRKPAISSRKGLVASQHYLASAVGAEILQQGGNAIDAAIATGLTLGVVEPWMSGLGGGGYMTIYLAEQKQVKVIEFGMQAPAAADTADYPLAGTGTNAGDAFNWPKVIGDTNIHGPLAAAVPGYIKGISLTLETFGTMDWQDVIEPACLQAEQGLPIDWFSAQKISLMARGLNLYPETRSVYLADGLPPTINLDGTLDFLKLGRLAETYRILQSRGADEFYQGELARQIAGDLAEAGSRMTVNDLQHYEADISEPTSTHYRGHTLHAPGSLTAGPSIAHALNYMEENYKPGEAPDADTFKQYAAALLSAYEHRLTNLGEGQQGNTSHLCVTDRAGNVVSLTQTIMSAFGSRIMLPQSGILMNNGMMWFDPRPGGPNSVKGSRKPLCNMCPVILEAPNGSLTALGACGGRKIFPAVFQLTSLLADFGLSVDEAAHQPRIDVSGTDEVTVMDHMQAEIIDSIRAHYTNVRVAPHGVSPNLFALPQLIRLEKSGVSTGACFIPSPHARVISET